MEVWRPRLSTTPTPYTPMFPMHQKLDFDTIQEGEVEALMELYPAKFSSEIRYRLYAFQRYNRWHTRRRCEGISVFMFSPETRLSRPNLPIPDASKCLAYACVIEGIPAPRLYDEIYAGRIEKAPDYQPYDYIVHFAIFYGALCPGC